ncbi:MAG: hypothetical protein E7066_01070 [Lentimicrobiaceae bacterium]|nr:hypothetical protein [Lentimicrobiaceae bacterium]
MKKTFKILVVVLATGLLTTSCVEKSKKYQQLLSEKEAAVVENQQIEAEYNNALGIISDVENNLQAIREAEGLMMMNNENLAGREKLNAELNQIKEAMALNGVRLDSLNDVLQNSKRDNKQLRSTVKKLQAQLEEKTRVIDSLQIQINERDNQITGLNVKVENLNADIKEVQAINDSQAQTIADQIVQMNTVYYMAATKKELKENGILNSKYILNKEVPTEKFVQVDKRELDKITLEAKKAVVLSAHPVNSYKIVKNENTITLQINNPEQFWSVTKYLVISTK